MQQHDIAIDMDRGGTGFTFTSNTVTVAEWEWIKGSPAD